MHILIVHANFPPSISSNHTTKADMKTCCSHPFELPHMPILTACLSHLLGPSETWGWKFWRQLSYSLSSLLFRICKTFPSHTVFICVMCGSSAVTHVKYRCGHLTHWGWDKMDAISQKTFSSAFSWMKVKIPIKISLKFVPKGPINNDPALVQIMAWRRSGKKPFSESVTVSLLMHICVNQP